MTRFLTVAFLVLNSSTINSSPLSTPQGAQGGGYVVGNFGISAQIIEADGLEAQIQLNPPELGKFLQDFARGKLWIEDESPSARRLQLRPIEVSRLYPEYRAKFDVEGGLSAEIRFFAPLGMSSRNGFLPALIVQTTLQANSRWKGRLGYTLTPKTPAPTPAENLRSGELSGLIRGPAFLGLNGAPSQRTTLDETANDLTVSAPIQLGPGARQKLTFIVGAFHANGYYANEYTTAAQLLSSLATHIAPLGAQLQEFIAALPVTGDRAIDTYLRWYVSAGILLTKGIRTGEVLTMGYVELNQRDSFWTSGIHLVFWPDLERKMILETVRGQLANGRIPVTILPTIDRGDELDSAEYFILRTARYYRWQRDDALLEEAWPAVKKAIAYLVSRDFENAGSPMQTSYWADWKDVPGVEGRTYAPHFVLLYVAALKSAVEFASVMNDTDAAREYRERLKKAEAFANRSFENGGLWNGNFYIDRWKDGRRPEYLLQDQLVGAYFDVIPRERLKTIYQRIQANETPYGVRETYPYAHYSSGFHKNADQHGNYHNGGIWPWINFMDVTGRYKYGRTADAERIIHKVGKADLETERDYQPGEFMNADTGKNLGFRIQAWDAALFSAIYFGAFGIERVSNAEIHIRVRTPKARDFSTRLMLPSGSGLLSSRSGKLSWQEDSVRQQPRQGVKVKVFDEREGGNNL